MPSTFVKVLALLSAASVMTAAAAAQNAAGSAAGAQVFMRNCSGCHGGDGRGSDKAPAIATMPRVVSMTDAQLIDVVTNGTQSGMPPFGSLGAQNVEAAVRYLRGLQGVPFTGGGAAAAGGAAGGGRAGGGRGRGANAGAAGGGTINLAQEKVTGDPASGKTLFFGAKAQCSNCHAVAGQGSAMASDMTTYARTHAVAAIEQSIVNPGAAAAPAGGRRGGGGGFGGFGAAPAKAVELELKSGQKLTGLVRGEDNMSVVLITRDGRFHFIDRGTVAKETTLKTLMPEDYGTRLSRGEVNDIVAYLVESAKTAPEEPAMAAPTARRRGGD